MLTEYYCPRWGSENVQWNKFCENVKRAGFDGVEAPVPEDPKEQILISATLKEYNLKWIGQYYQSFEKDFELHKANYTEHLYRLCSVQPIKINAQTGKDYFSFKQNAELFAIAEAISKETGIAISHETHRNKALFAAHTSQQFLLQLPAINITADFSHWCNVAESLLDDQQDAVDLACRRAAHIHARVGHAQSAQVIDPRLPLYKNELEAHLKWWDKIIAAHINKKKAVLTITTEFGPAPYMVHLPFTNMPLADQWNINVFMMQLLKERYSKFTTIIL